MSVNQAIAKRPRARRERAPAWQRSQTRAAILDAARMLFERDGIDRLSLSRVAQEANFAPSTVYAYFVKKADMVCAIVADDLASFARTMSEAFPFSAPEEASIESAAAGGGEDEQPVAAPHTWLDLESLAASLIPAEPAIEEAPSECAVAEEDTQPDPMPSIMDPVSEDTAQVSVVQLEEAAPHEAVAEAAVQASSEPAVASGAIGMLEARIAQLEGRRVDAWLERRLREFERMLAALDERVGAGERGAAASGAPVESALQELRQRVEISEKKQGVAVAEQAKIFSDQLEAVESRLRQTMSELRTRALEIAGRVDAIERDRELRAVAEQMSLPQRVPDPAPSNAAQGEPAHSEQDTSAPDDAADVSDETYLAAARRAALAAQSLAHEDAEGRDVRKRTRLFFALCAGLCVALVGAGVLLKHNLESPAFASSPKFATDGASPTRFVKTIALSEEQKPVAVPTAAAAKTSLATGLAYLDGAGVARDDAQAAAWISKAAVAGDPVAQYWLGTLFEHGRGERADPGEAIRWYEASALQGNLRAMYKLAVSYAEGWGTPKNYGEAARWFSRAAELGFVNAQYNLGVLYERGLGVPQSLLDAYKWYSLAASQGDKDSAARIDALSSQMSAEDLASARQAVAAFKPQPRDAAANAVAVPLSAVAPKGAPATAPDKG